MAQLRTRREVMRLTGAGIVGMTVAGPVHGKARGQGDSAPPEGEIQVRRTYAEKRYAQEAPLRWQASGGTERSAIRLDPGRTFKDVLGFGASFTDAACYMVNQPSQGARDQLLHELFHPSEMGFSTTREVIRSGMYWALAHYSRTIRRGARRFGSDGALEGISHVAFANPDGTRAAVLTNAGPERTAHLQLAGRATEVALPKDSITTLTWR